MTQSNKLAMLTRIGIGEDSLAEQARGIGMDEVAAIAAQQHEIGTGIRMLSVNDTASELSKRDVGGDHTHHAAIDT